MSRLRALAAAALVAAAVFYYLAAPALRALLGPLVVLPLYALLSLVVGVATYVGVRYLLARVDEPDESATEGVVGDDVPGVAGDVTDRGNDLGGADADEDDERDVEGMLGELDAEREK